MHDAPKKNLLLIALAVDRVEAEKLCMLSYEAAGNVGVLASSSAGRFVKQTNE